MPLIQLIRHAESIANAGGVSLTPSCIPLSDLGHEQARLLPQHFQAPPDLVVVSPFIRTSQTAAPLLSQFPGVPVETWPVQEFTYLNAESYRNTTVAQRSPAAQAYWQRADIGYCDGPGAESFAHFMGRVDALIDRLTQETSRHVTIFSHGFFISAVLWRCMHPQAEVDAGFMSRYREHRLSNPVPNAHIVAFQKVSGTQAVAAVR